MTRKQIKAMLNQLGGPVAVASELSRLSGKPITHAALCQWTRVPAGWVIHVEDIASRLGLAYDRHQLRPDVFGIRPNRSGRKKAA